MADEKEFDSSEEVEEVAENDAGMAQEQQAKPEEDPEGASEEAVNSSQESRCGCFLPLQRRSYPASASQ